jgi:hypothetical protein
LIEDGMLTLIFWSIVYDMDGMLGWHVGRW